MAHCLCKYHSDCNSSDLNNRLERALLEHDLIQDELRRLDRVKAPKSNVYTASELANGALDYRYFRNEFALPSLQDYVFKFDELRKEISLHSGHISVMDYGAIGDGVADDTFALQAALDYGKDNVGSEQETVVLVPPGKYRITERLKIYRKTRLVAYGAHIIRGGYVSLIMNVPSDSQENVLLDANDDYSGHGDIIIEGGLWDGNVVAQPYANTGFNGMYFANAKNILLKNLTIKDIVTCHGLDLNAVKDMRIENCNFIGYIDATVSGDEMYPRDYAEAIQISNMKERVGAKGTPCENITVEDCYFGASGTVGTQAWPVGVGGHSAIHNKFTRDITINNCLFDGNTCAGVKPFKFINTKIINSTFLKCKAGVFIVNTAANTESSKYFDETTNSFVQSGMPQTGTSIIITGNYFEDISEQSICGWGERNGASRAVFKRIIIDNNVIRYTNNNISSQTSIDLTHFSNISISNSLIIGGFRGVLLNNCSYANINGVMFEGLVREGIWVNDNDDEYRNKGESNNIYIYNNNFNSLGYSGLYLHYIKTGKVEGNTFINVGNLEDNARQAIYFAYCEDIEVESNYVKMGTNRAKYGVNIATTNYNIRIGANKLEGATAPLYIPDQANGNWCGHYAYDPDGQRWKFELTSLGGLKIEKA